ncbi:alpha/beta hydrolase family esterase [Blastopirellula marina]|uniref:Possible conserved lipoprotein lpqp n=1 Tax=Blastopirellula marina DSM 3645 TaxID=314230 RepID=A3ZU34_9BACT|nr:PHB depolymerase family esterase [Blastopirellula marina]EAQ80098.1 possible conserved lipoprotein lpqp [Blastopirellula marina DSM 3645]
MITTLRKDRCMRVIVVLAMLLIGFGLVVYYRSSRNERPFIVVSIESINLDGESRSYRLTVPASRPDAPLPIVVALHGIGDSTESMAHYSQLDRLAARGECYVVYPEAYKAMWNVVGISPENLAQNRDLRFIDELLARLRNQLDIDGVYLIGMSNGATFAQALLFTRTDIDAVVAHSGSKPKGLEPSDNASPILLIVGANDPVIDAIRRDAATYRAAGYSVQLIEAPHLGHQWSTPHNAQIEQFLLRRRQP